MQVGSVRTFLDGVLASEEYAHRLAARAAGAEARTHGNFLNSWIPGWEGFGRPPGELSTDGVVVVGQQGQLFIYGGSNHNLAAQRGEVAMAPGWLEEWRELVAGRAEEALRMGRQLALVVVPEKLAVYADLFPEALTPTRPRPALRLTEEARLPLVYPLDVLRAARRAGETYLRTDSHLTPRGNLLLAEAALAALNVPAALLPEVADSLRTHLASGDLGSHFEPQELELVVPMAGVSHARLIADNWSQITSAGGHIGTTRIFRRDDSPDGRTLVIFGDSYSFGDDSYRGLSWFLAQVFREVHFVWAPFGWDPDYIDSVGAGLVICQTAERFVGRVPLARVDVKSLAEETVARQTALTDDRLFVS